MVLFRRTIICIITCLTISLYAYAENSNVRFRRLTINDGLSLSSVYVIFQDSKGFIWCGTEDGLNKYDGQHFTVYHAVPGNENSLAHKWTELISEDSKGGLWFGSCGGLTHFDPRHEAFTQYKTDLSVPRKISNDTITTIRQVSENILLIGTYSGINQLNLETQECSALYIAGIPEDTRIDHIEGIDDDLYVLSGPQGTWQVNTVTSSSVRIDLQKGGRVNSLKISGGWVWIGTDKGGFRYPVRQNRKPSGNIFASRVASIPEIRVEEMLFDKTGNLWFSSPLGLYNTNLKGEADLVVPSESTTHSLALIPGQRILEDQQGNIWYATHGDGIFRINKKTGTVDNFRNNPCDPESLSENAINCIFKDISGSLWFGTFGAGISVYNPSSQRFVLLRHDPTTTNTMASNFTWTICEDRRGNIWIGSNDRGISVYSKQDHSYTHYDHNPNNPQSLSHSSVRKIYEDSKGTIWVGTDGGGLNRFNESTGTFTHYMADPSDVHSISDNSVRVIYEDRKGILWIGTRNGLNRFNEHTEVFTSYLHTPGDPNSISHNFVYSSIYQDTKNNLWIGTYGGGLNKFNIEEEKFEHYRYDPNDPKSLSNDIVFSIVEDSDGILWIGTNSRLNRFNPETSTFSRFGIADGLPNEVIYGVIPDDFGNLWLSTNLGICRFSPADSGTINYDFTDGLQSNEFNGGAFHRGHSGDIYFGGVYGVNIIDPEVLGSYSDHSKMVITRLEIVGNDVQVLPVDAKRSDRNRVSRDSSYYYLQDHISYASEIVMDYNIRYFSLEFADVGNMNSANIQYAYTMEGLDDNWHFSGNRNFVSYANIPPGKYDFKVRSQQPDDSWNKNIASLKIIVTPPFWMSWWFILMEIILAMAVAYSIYNYLLKLRTNRLLKEQNDQINIANKKLQKSEKNLKLINATKDKFFSIISHDLKNPFTSLLSISETMHDNYEAFDEEEKKTSVGRIHGSIKHIYTLLENLLTWSRTQTGTIQFDPGEFNLSRLMEENFLLYEHIAAKKDIKLTLSAPEDITVYADRNMINTAVRNLLNNSIKFTGPGKSIEIGINEHPQETEVFVSDTGVGISEEAQQKLFRIDQKVKTTGTDGEKGTGLGLIICKEFVVKNGGSIGVESKPGSGSRFRFTIPKTGVGSRESEVGSR